MPRGAIDHVGAQIEAGGAHGRMESHFMHPNSHFTAAVAPILLDLLFQKVCTFLSAIVGRIPLVPKGPVQRAMRGSW
mgnify:CR=1 FL=1